MTTATGAAAAEATSTKRSSRRRSRKTTVDSERAVLETHREEEEEEEEEENDYNDTDDESLRLGESTNDGCYYSDCEVHDADDDDNFSTISDDYYDYYETTKPISTTDLVKESQMQVDFCEMTVQEMNQIMDWWSSNAWMEGDDNQDTVAPHNSLLRLDTEEDKEQQEQHEEEEEASEPVSDECSSSHASCELALEPCAASQDVLKDHLQVLPVVEEADAQTKQTLCESSETTRNTTEQSCSGDGNSESLDDTPDDESIDILLGVRKTTKTFPPRSSMSHDIINLGDLELPPLFPSQAADTGNTTCSNLLIDQPHPRDVTSFSPFQSVSFWSSDDDKFTTPLTSKSESSRFRSFIDHGFTTPLTSRSESSRFRSFIDLGLEELPGFFRSAFSTPQKKKAASGLVTSISGSDDDEDDEEIPDFSLRSCASALDVASPEELHHSVRVQHDEIRRLLFQTRDMADQVAALTESSATEEDEEVDKKAPLDGRGGIGDTSECNSDDDLDDDSLNKPTSRPFSTPPSTLPLSLSRCSSKLRRRRRRKSIATSIAAVDQGSSPSSTSSSSSSMGRNCAIREIRGIAQLPLRKRDHLWLCFLRLAMRLETRVVSQVLVPFLPVPLLLYLLHRPKRLRKLLLSILISIMVFLPLFVWCVYPRRMSITEAPLPSMDLFLQQPFYNRYYYLQPTGSSSAVLLTGEGDQDFGLL